MSDSPPTVPADSHEEAEAFLDTGIRGQRLVINGWFASHADCGSPGPHVRLNASGDMDAVLTTGQIPALVEGLTTVAERIDRMRERDGEEFLEATDFAQGPDPNGSAPPSA
ncbi:MAG: hypothetical protein ABIQ59_18270 [Nocardioidaceae bacterium]